MWINLLVVLAIWLAPSLGQAAIDCVDAGATEFHGDAPADPKTVSYTTPAGDNRITLVGVAYRGGDRSSTTATIGGNAMTESQTHVHDGVTAGGQIFYYVNPPSGTNDVVVNWEPTGAPLNGSIIILTCTGVDQVSPFRSTNGTSATTGTTATVTLGSINAGDVAVDVVSSDDTTSLSVGANQTVIHDGATSSSMAGMSYQAGADGGVMSWTLGATDNWAILAVALKPFETDDGGEPIWFP